MSGRAKDPTLKAQRLARDRLVRLERQAKARAEAVAVAEGVAETVALSRARGAAVVGGGRGTAKAQPLKRLSGLEWLAAKGRISAEAKAAGERYGWVYRRVKLDKAIPSTLDVRVRGQFVAPSLEDVLAHGEGTETARRRLAEFRRRLSGQPDLVAACDLVCGEEKTPREAAAGDRDAGRLEAVLKVALDILMSA
jgi:hypothetical protein